MTIYLDELGPTKLSQQSALEGKPQSAIDNPKRAWGMGFFFRSMNTGDGLETLCRHHPAIVAMGIFAPRKHKS